MTGYLTDILERKRAELRASPPRPVDAVLPPARPFASALRRRGELAVVAEVKRRSPSKGDLAPGLNPARQVILYEQGGAAACSILTDSHFDGTLADLRAARDATELPLLRKDFLVDPRQCAEGRAAGADAVLLIVAALEGTQLSEMLDAASEAGAEALVEVHDEADIDRALEAGASLIGVNNRDLHTFAVDLETSVRLAPRFPDGVTRVAESGITNGPDARKLADAGYHAVLVGEALVKTPDPIVLLNELRCG